MNKIVKINECTYKLRFVNALKNATNKSLLECKNIADSVIKTEFKDGDIQYSYGVLLLNESSITQEQWESVANAMKDELKWEYIEL